MQNKILAKLDKQEQQFNKYFSVINKQFVKIDQRFDKIDKRFIKIDQRFDKIDKRFDNVNERLDSQLEAILKNRDDIDWLKKNIVTKKENAQTVNSLDHLTYNMFKIKEDKVFIVEWLKRLQSQVDVLSV